MSQFRMTAAISAIREWWKWLFVSARNTLSRAKTCSTRTRLEDRFSTVGPGTLRVPRLSGTCIWPSVSQCKPM